MEYFQGHMETEVTGAGAGPALVRYQQNVAATHGTVKLIHAQLRARRDIAEFLPALVSYITFAIYFNKRYVDTFVV